MTLKAYVGGAVLSQAGSAWQDFTSFRVFVTGANAVEICFATPDESVATSRAWGAGYAQGFNGVSADWGLNFEVAIA